MFDEDRHHSQQPHADGEVGFLHRCRRGRAAAALTELDVGGEELDDEWTHPLLQQETELLVLRRRRRDRGQDQARSQLSFFFQLLKRNFTKYVGFIE